MRSIDCIYSTNNERHYFPFNRLIEWILDFMRSFENGFLRESVFQAPKMTGI